MLTYQRNLLKSRVNTILGVLFIFSWALACGLVVWHASYDTDPVEQAFVKALVPQMDVDSY